MVKIIDRILTVEERKERTKYIERIVSQEFSDPNYFCLAGIDSFSLRTKGFKNYFKQPKIQANLDPFTHITTLFVNDSAFSELAKKIADRYKNETGYEIIITNAKYSDLFKI